MSNLEGAILSDYLLLQCISKGGIADVYRARQNGEGNHEVAAKVFRSSFAQRATFRDYFMTEAEKIGQFEHPYILPLLEFGEGEDLLYLVMPYVASGTLEDLLKRVGGKLSALQALPIIQQLCSAVQYAHNQGVTHGNLKPSNIFVAADGRILLSDFGIVRDYDDSQQSLTRVGWGSAEYAAPEQSMGILKRSSDIYSLGVLLYRILAGQPPFTGQTPVEVLLKHVRQPLPSIRTIVPGISAAVDGVLQMALQKRADDRFASAEELSNAFYAAVTVAPIASPVARPVSSMNPQTPPVPMLSTVGPRTPVPAGYADYLPGGGQAAYRNNRLLTGPMTPTPLAVQQQASAAQFPAHPQGLPRVTKQLSPSLPFESNYAGNTVTPRQSPANMAEEHASQQPYFEPGVVIGGQHFWSAEPVEWSPIGNKQNNAALKNDVPLHASTYLQDKADAKPTQRAALSQSPPSASAVSFEGPLPVPAAISTQSKQEPNEEVESAFALRLRKLLPIIVVVLLLLGLLGALLSSVFFPSSGPGADIAPLHSVAGTLVSSLKGITM
ncbi:MAG TPA: serine/threonine-protein kinase [Ktedonobacteraceae bacterium]|nr:serine/threonine-protein kinase [Ktedonobacteraceae bacterium]